MAGDLEAGRHWADRVLRRAAAEPGSVPDLQVASVRLHRSRSGAEPVAEAVLAARPLVDGARSRSSQDPYLPMVLLELGVAENWLGELTAAEQHLGECLLVSRSEAEAVTRARPSRATDRIARRSRFAMDTVDPPELVPANRRSATEAERCAAIPRLSLRSVRIVAR